MNFLSQEQKERLLFRRQFVVGPTPIKQFPSWRSYEISNGYILSVHPELSVCPHKTKEYHAFLIGFMVDWRNPEHDDLTILRALFDKIDKIDDVFEKCSGLGGRWVLIISDDANLILFNDPSGLCQVFYTSKDCPEKWIASQSSLIAELLGISDYGQKEKEFINSFYFVNSPEYWWPGESSPYHDIRHLMPNHFLDLESLTVKRFWPVKPKKEVSFDTAIHDASRILTGLLHAANNRFELALPLTAGQDSRLLLAACREISQDVYFYTQKYHSMKNNDRDIIVPAKLLNSLGYKHHIIGCPEKMDDDFEEIYKRNVATAHDVWGNKVQGLFQQYPQDKVCIKGNCNEIARCEYHRYGYPQNINAEFIASLTYGLQDNQFAIQYYEKWLEGLGDVENKYGYRVLDLFYWEHKMGCWQAMAQQEWDMAYEEFTPFNCRELLEIMLGVNEAYRKPPGYIFFMKLIGYMWPEVLSEPINPVNLKGKIVLKLKEFLGLFNAFHFVQRIYYRVKRGR